MNTQHDQLVPLVDDSRHALQGVRSALIDLYAAVGADPASPQDVARKLGINRNLTWKLSRVITSHEPFATLNHLPGQQGFELALRAFRRGGAPGSAIDAVQAAMNRFYEVIGLHAGDREQFELTLESMGMFEREYRLESGRELAFRGNSMIWGVQARTRLSVAFLAPSGPATVDCVLLSAFMGFRRLRPSARWRLFRAQLQDDEGKALPSMLPEDIESKGPGDTPMLFREFCSPNMPEIETAVGPDGREYILPGGPVGNMAVFDCVCGYIARGLPTYKAPGNDFGSTAAQITLPIETLVQDLILHRDIIMPQEPEVLVYGFPHGGVDNPNVQTVQNLLPITAEPVELAGMPPAVATPLVPRYSQITARIYERMGWNASEFRGLRVQMPYPPMSSRVVLRWPLPDAPK